MPFAHVGSETTTAPRQLERVGQLGKPVVGPWGSVTYPNAPPASVDGKATTTHEIWRCTACRALAVTTGEKPPTKCGKCGR